MVQAAPIVENGRRLSATIFLLGAEHKSRMRKKAVILAGFVLEKKLSEIHVLLCSTQVVRLSSLFILVNRFVSRLANRA